MPVLDASDPGVAERLAVDRGQPGVDCDDIPRRRRLSAVARVLERQGSGTVSPPRRRRCGWIRLWKIGSGAGRDVGQAERFANSDTRTGVWKKSGLRSSGSHRALQSNPQTNSAGSAFIVYSWTRPGVAGPAGDLSAASSVSFTQLSDGTRVTVSNTTSVLAAGYRFLSQSSVSRSVTGAVDEVAAFVVATFALNRGWRSDRSPPGAAERPARSREDPIRAAQTSPSGAPRRRPVRPAG